MLSDQEIYDRMKNGWRSGKPETICGPGSTLGNTRFIRKWLPWVCERYEIRSINDAGAGDLYWISRVQWGDLDIQYQGYDLIPRHEEVRQWDITKEPLPECDLILCRLVLGHLDQPRREMALDLFKKSAKYLAATQFYLEDVPKDAKETVRVDLRPFLGEPMEVINDGNHDKCRMALWKL